MSEIKDIRKMLDNIKVEMPKFEIPRIPKINHLDLTPIINNSIIDEMNREKEEEYEREQTYKKSVLQALKNIEENTGNIVDIVSLIRVNNDKQDQVITLLSEILSVGGSASQEEAESKFKKAMKKIEEFNGSVESMQKFTSILFMVYNSVKSMF